MDHLKKTIKFVELEIRFFPLKPLKIIFQFIFFRISFQRCHFSTYAGFPSF